MHIVAACHVLRHQTISEHCFGVSRAIPNILPCLPPRAVAWLLGNEERQLQAALAAPEARDAAKRLDAQDWQVGPSAIVCKAGGRPYTVWQATEHDDGARGGAT